LHQAVVAELGQLLDADAGGAQHFHDRPGPECLAFFGGQVAAFAGPRVIGPDAGGGRGDRAGQGLPGGGDGGAGAGLAGGEQQGFGVAVVPGGGAGQHRQDGKPFAGPGIHP